MKTHLAYLKYREVDTTNPSNTHESIYKVYDDSGVLYECCVSIRDTSGHTFSTEEEWVDSYRIHPPDVTEDRHSTVDVLTEDEFFLEMI